MKTAILCPGGGYRLIGTNEGEPVAERFRELCYDANVLNYSVGNTVTFTEAGFADFKPAQELMQAMQAARTRVGDDGYIVLAGFSAGGHLSAGYCFSNTMPDTNVMPDALLLSYPMLHLGNNYDVNDTVRAAFDIPAQIRKFGIPERAHDLPIHIWHATSDKLIPFESSPAFVELLRSAGADVNFAKFNEGRHGNPATTNGWFETAMEYLNK